MFCCRDFCTSSRVTEEECFVSINASPSDCTMKSVFDTDTDIYTTILNTVCFRAIHIYPVGLSIFNGVIFIVVIKGNTGFISGEGGMGIRVVSRR